MICFFEISSISVICGLPFSQKERDQRRIDQTEDHSTQKQSRERLNRNERRRLTGCSRLTLQPLRPDYHHHAYKKQRGRERVDKRNGDTGLQTFFERRPITFRRVPAP